MAAETASKGRQRDGRFAQVAQHAPAFLGTLAELEHHVQHAVTGATPISRAVRRKRRIPPRHR